MRPVLRIDKIGRTLSARRDISPPRGLINVMANLGRYDSLRVVWNKSAIKAEPAEYILPHYLLRSRTLTLESVYFYRRGAGIFRDRD